MVGTMRCVSWPDDVMGGGESLPSEAGTVHHDSGTTITAVTSGDDDDDGAVPQPVNCAAQVVTWTGDGGVSCDVALEAGVAYAASVTLEDSVVPDTGNVTATCSGGVFRLTNAVCEPPHLFDVSGPKGCVNGFCEAVLDGNCGTADPAKAKAICIFLGYADQVGFDTTNGSPNQTQCLAGASRCRINQAACNIIFTKVTCRH
jgi:hypothetical protein